MAVPIASAAVAKSWVNAKSNRAAYTQLGNPASWNINQGTHGNTASKTILPRHYYCTLPEMHWKRDPVHWKALYHRLHFCYSKNDRNIFHYQGTKNTCNARVAQAVPRMQEKYRLALLSLWRFIKLQLHKMKEWQNENLWLYSFRKKSRESC